MMHNIFAMYHFIIFQNKEINMILTFQDVG